MNRFLLFIFLFTTNLWAQNLGQSFPAGKGSNYKLKLASDPSPVQVSVYVAGTRVDSVHIEYFLETKSLIPVQMWQQFEIGVKPTGMAEIRKGYIQSKEMQHPEILPPSYLAGAAGGIQVNDFLFQDKSKLDKIKVGEETVEIAAGSTKATHYRTKNNGQTVDFWISDAAKPMGLVLLTSKSDSNPNQNYTLELVSLIDNVRAKILPEAAKPLSKATEKYLARPESLR